MARAETVAAIGRHRNFIRQQPLPVGEDLQRARLFRLAGGGVVAARDENHGLVVQPHPYLVRVDAGVYSLSLHDLRTRRRVGVDPINPKSARITERDQQVLGGNIGGHVYRAGWQCDRIAVRRQRPRARVNTERGHVMLVAGRTHPGRAVARRHVKIPPRGVRPRIMDVRRQSHDTPLVQRGAVDVYIVLRELLPDAGVERYFIRARLAWCGSRHGSGTL